MRDFRQFFYPVLLLVLALLLPHDRLAAEIIYRLLMTSMAIATGGYVWHRLLSHREEMARLNRPITFRLPDGVDITNLLGDGDGNQRLLKYLETHDLLEEEEEEEEDAPSEFAEDAHSPVPLRQLSPTAHAPGMGMEEAVAFLDRCPRGGCTSRRDPRCEGKLCVEHCIEFCANPTRRPCVHLTKKTSNDPIP